MNRRKFIMLSPAVFGASSGCTPSKTQEDVSGVIAGERGVLQDYSKIASFFELIVNASLSGGVPNIGGEDLNFLKVLIYDCQTLMIQNGLIAATDKHFQYFNRKTFELKERWHKELAALCGSLDMVFEDPNYQQKPTLIALMRCSYIALSCLEALCVRFPKSEVKSKFIDSVYREISWVLAGLKHQGFEFKTNLFCKSIVEALSDNTRDHVIEVTSLAATYDESSRKIWGSAEEFKSFSVFGGQPANDASTVSGIYADLLKELK